MVSPQMSEEAQQALIEEFGLDQSKLTQYGLYMKELLHGNLGKQLCQANSGFPVYCGKAALDAAAFGGSHADRHSDWHQRGLVRSSPQRKTFDRVISVLVTMGISVFIPFMAFLLLYIFPLS